MSSFITIENAKLMQKSLTCTAKEKKRQVTISDCMGHTKDPNIEILVPPFDDNLEANIPLVCYVSDFSHKEIKVDWLRNFEKHVSQVSEFKVLKGEDDLFSGIIKTNVSRKSWKDGDTYTCRVNNKGEIILHNISICSGSFVKPDVNLELPSNEDLMQDNGRVSCSVLGSNPDPYKTSLYFNNEDSNENKDGKTIISVTQDRWKSVKKVSCVVTKSACPFIKTKVSKDIAYTPREISSPNVQVMASCEKEIKGTSTLICLVSDFWPQDASVVWLNNGKILSNEGEDFTAMLNKNDMYFGKSEISVKWIEKDFYTCSVSHQGLHYLQNITKCSACQSSFEEPVVDLTLPSNEDLLNGNAKIKCSVRISNLDVSQVSLKLNKILTTKIPSFGVDNTLKNTYTATFTVSQDEWKGINTVTCVVKRPCTSIPAEVSKEIVPDGDILKPSFRDLFLAKEGTVSCRTNMVLADIQWIVNDKSRKAASKKSHIKLHNTTWIQSTIAISLTEWKEDITFSCKLNPPQESLQQQLTIVRRIDDMKVPTMHLLPPDQATAMNDFLLLTCLVVDFYPEDLFVIWKINDSLAKEEVSNVSQVNCNHNVKQCSAISQLLILKSEWIKGTTYSCLVAHISSDVYIIKNISAIPMTSEPNIQKPSFNEMLLFENITVHCRTSIRTNDMNWLLDKTEILTSSQRKDEQMLYKDTESVQVTIQIPLAELKTSSTQFCNEEFYNTTDPSMIKLPKVYLLPPVNERTKDEYLTLICLVNGFYPQDLFVTWKMNDTTIKQDFPHVKEVFCDPDNHVCSYVSQLPIVKEQWLGGMSYACLVAHFPSKYYSRSNISRPNDVNSPADIRNLYDDDGGEELGELEEINNVWTTTSTFIALFLVTLIYSGFVTFVKVK
ncbi:uncharacterized protein [Engystomops pustulosus]|uniref:uncharacterized protein n=1 Tax=Engystomops pustulosus TaxID=76066 RepID=UPI003AFAB61D